MSSERVIHQLACVNDSHLMAAAAELFLDVPVIVSPELALVDSELASDLRRTLRVASEQVSTASSTDRPCSPPQSATTHDAVIDVIDDIVEAIASTWPTATLVADDASSATDIAVPAPEVSPPVSAPPVTAHDAVVESATELQLPVEVPAPADEGTHETSYPALPAIDPMTSQETEAALERIRKQLAADAEPVRRRRRIRRGFTVASGLIATYALASVAAALSFGLA